MKILAVDDEPLVLRLLETTLANLGYANSDFATTGQNALELLTQAKTPYSCILLDIRMPGMNGIELCQHIRQIPAYRHTPIIMLTAVAEKEYIDESFASGATDFINKPVDPTELGARLRVAKLIQTERQRSMHLEAAATTAETGTEAVPPFEFNDPVQVDGVPRVVNSMALENYLLQLDRVGLFRIGMIGFQIRHARSLYASNGVDEFYGILTDVAEAIFENTRAAHALIAYVGSGAFVAVVPRVKLYERHDMEDNIALTLNEIQMSDLLEPDYNVRVAVGPQVNGSVFGNTPQKMIDLAIRAAQGAAEGRHGSLTASRLWSKFA